jgi:hypothetical protein
MLTALVLCQSHSRAIQIHEEVDREDKMEAAWTPWHAFAVSVMLH